MRCGSTKTSPDMDQRHKTRNRSSASAQLDCTSNIQGEGQRITFWVLLHIEEEKKKQNDQRCHLTCVNPRTRESSVRRHGWERRETGREKLMQAWLAMQCEECKAFARGEREKDISAVVSSGTNQDEGLRANKICEPMSGEKAAGPCASIR